ncbi:hypothetical protein [Streptomyces syringium]|uniref:Uncharacterized protein n=1 Tax=Streptomyces syringium TaxID=76729 RepID=A0ABS4XVN9_9ACTN|nr:hypothetical protein [Streptomyces syringium]MBP2400583.1 hypothetical protein [Streptomyces syringium]
MSAVLQKRAVLEPDSLEWNWFQQKVNSRAFSDEGEPMTPMPPAAAGIAVMSPVHAAAAVKNRAATDLRLVIP